MRLSQRMYGYSLSEIEKELIFRREDVGYVRPLNKAGTVFYLDPSPFFRSQKREVYLALCPPPAEGLLVRASVSDQKEEIMKDRSGYYTLSIKCVKGWEKVDSNSLLSRRHLISPEEVRDFFTLPYRGEEEVVGEIALCSALYSVSSPPVHDERGGINTAIFGKKKSWAGFKRSMEIIPAELKRTTSDHFYRISAQDDKMTALPGKEINLAYLNPESTPMHIPLVLDVETKPLSAYRESWDAQKPLVTAFMLDALMIQPVLSDHLDHYMTDVMYELVSDVKSSGSMPYMQDFGSLIPRLGASLSRYNARFEVKKEDVQKSVDIWSDMFYRAKKAISTEHPVSQLYRLSDKARKLYIDLHDVFGVDKPILIPDIAKHIHIFPNHDDYEVALDDLNRQGLIIRMDRRKIKLLDFGKKCLA